jgi:hypothetical protein
MVKLFPAVFGRPPLALFYICANPAVVVGELMSAFLETVV